MSSLIRNKYREWFIESNTVERIWLLAKIDFRQRYYEHKLGLFWALMKPLSQIFLYYLVFVVMMGQRIENYPIYLFAGLLIWGFFVDCSTGTITILRSKKNLYEFTNMSKLEIYIAFTVSGLIGLFFNLGIYEIGALIGGILPTYHYIFLIPLFINLYILGLGISMILSNLYLLFKDISQIWGIAIMFGFFLSPILYRGEMMKEKIPILIYLNPMAGIINNGRDILFHGQMMDWNIYLYDLAYAILILLIGIFFFRKLSPQASELI